MTLDQIKQDTADSIASLNEKLRDATTLGRPADAVEYANALRDTAAAYRDLCFDPDD